MDYCRCHVPSYSDIYFVWPFYKREHNQLLLAGFLWSLRKERKTVLMAARFSILLFSATIFLIIHASANLTEEEINVVAPAVQFSYVGASGPSHWGSLNSAFSTCSKGKSQSPVDISTEKVFLDKHLKPLTRKYTSINATLVNNGFNIGLRCGQSSGFLISDGKVFNFKQMHWHSPSEHKINGVQYAAELHLVHRADDGGIAVISVLYELGHADPLIAKIDSKLHQLAKERIRSVNEQPEIAVGEFNMHQLKKDTHKYYRYAGSLTTPPCNETVTWYLLGKVRSLSEEQLEALKAPLGWGYKNNARPTQPLNGRLVELYREEIIN
ncbi:OLC1v1034201C1 [Oldenlandia corymbosa var. corymbosa]|uniref:Carbonic anhydrase n=1 Tax=Oldenlandia corymbosa var. corymbosa TaxID=529605 RepID=A0AAV1CRP8_OLDCO|nr:OLC1v1034201C1 [Oldenlandia corymbosa var. corymbosa]